MKRTRPLTAPALLDGLYKLFTMLEVLEHHSVDQLKSLHAPPFLNTQGMEMACVDTYAP